MIDKYLVGFELDTGKPLWISDDEICGHGCVFAKTGVGKTLWLESLVFQQLARGRASGCTFIDAKRDSGTLAHIILMALVTGRIEDLVITDPFDSVHAYNFVLTEQRADVKARKVLRTALPPTLEQSTTKHYDRLAADSVFRLVRALETLGLAWSIRDVAVALSAFNLAYPHLRSLLSNVGARQALVELGHLAVSYRSPKGTLDVARLTDNLRGIASELHAIAGSDVGQVLCTPYTDLALTDAILRGKMIYLMLPRLEEAESAARLVKVFREDLEVAIGEITSSRTHRLPDPHLIIIDEGASTFGPTWANLFEPARKGRFALLFGAQSTGALSDRSLGLSEAFYERIMANVNLKVMMRLGDSGWMPSSPTPGRDGSSWSTPNGTSAMPSVWPNGSMNRFCCRSNRARKPILLPRQRRRLRKHPLICRMNLVGRRSQATRLPSWRPAPDHSACRFVIGGSPRGRPPYLRRRKCRKAAGGTLRASAMGVVRREGSVSASLVAMGTSLANRPRPSGTQGRATQKSGVALNP